MFGRHPRSWSNIKPTFQGYIIKFFTHLNFCLASAIYSENTSIQSWLGDERVNQQFYSKCAMYTDLQSQNAVSAYFTSKYIPHKAKMQYLLTLQVSIYRILALRSSISLLQWIYWRKKTSYYNVKAWYFFFQNLSLNNFTIHLLETQY